MAARRLQISLRVLKNISRGSALFIIIINTNEIPHHFTFIYIYIFFFLKQKLQLHTINHLQPQLLSYF